MELLLLRRVHVSFLSNLKVRVLAPSSDTAILDPESKQVVYGDGTSGFFSSAYQRYAMTFEQEAPLLLSLFSLRETFRFEQELLDAFSSGLLDTSKKNDSDVVSNEKLAVKDEIAKKFRKQAQGKIAELLLR